MAAVTIKGDLAVTAVVNAVGLGPKELRNIVIQNIGDKDAYFSTENDLVAEETIRIAAGESVNTYDLTTTFYGAMLEGLFFLCKAGESTTVVWHA